MKRASPRNGFPKSCRIISSSEFTRILRTGTFAADDRLVVFVLPQADPGRETMPTRIGITIPKKTGNSPTRNHWKRHIREGFRIHRCHIPNGFDIIVRPKKDVELNGQAIQGQLHKLILRAMKRANRYDRNSLNGESTAE